MNKQLITIQEVAKKLGVSLDTLRRWDKNGKLKSIRLTPTGHRQYNLDDIESLSENIFSIAKNWVTGENPKEPEDKFYCADSIRFQSRLTYLENDLRNLPNTEKDFSLIVAATGEIGNNSFDHNIGSWTDIRGIFFAYDINKRQIVLADRGQGIFKTLKRVKPSLSTDKDALITAFSEKISGRAPESRGNGLKFVRKIITQSDNNLSIYFQSGNAILNLKNGDLDLNITQSYFSINGCLAFINF
ncbi:MAG: hypothetical protein US30_C0012G0052 [Candidatus Moranbacteria bacterium GW2011_GWF2_36_839]|nr:MAG: hypothetical protein US27_C0012G0026 [Candidatus Moranbacteria bacterium GW2011_GWF1_36_78]KKQ16742.1 MAG: hypothetical protein US30_C0012G0052 [Candidatus Moranbacteria bacterium GW2011_GWF2_36_839]HAT74255.1 hypothetical protein [Candidatus Moranbacteria bacterium]HBY11377.1 hypothetical protein [Candidatus Moranbacteria bacterium]